MRIKFFKPTQNGTLITNITTVSRLVLTERSQSSQRTVLVEVITSHFRFHETAQRVSPWASTAATVWGKRCTNKRTRGKVRAVKEKREKSWDGQFTTRARYRASSPCPAFLTGVSRATTRRADARRRASRRPIADRRRALSNSRSVIV